MKICHITVVHQRNDIRIFRKECISAAKAGHDVTLIVDDNLDNEVIDDVKIISINSQSKNRIMRIFSRKVKRRAFEEAIKINADIYHFHDPELLGLGIKLKKEGFRVIYDSHEDVPRQLLVKEWIQPIFRKILSIIFELYENKCSREFDAIIVPTPHIEERFSNLNKSVWKVCNFPSIKEIHYSEGKYSNLNPACYVGDLTIQRGILQIAEATNLSGIKLNLCGKFHSIEFKQELLRKYQNVSYLGILNRIEINNILSNSSIGFVTLLNTPNYSRSYPIKLFEYMAAGIPVISSNFPVYKEIVEGNKCGVCVDPLDIYAICEAIKLIVNNNEYSNILRINGRKAITENYNWESESKKLIECYMSCYDYESYLKKKDITKKYNIN